MNLRKFTNYTTKKWKTTPIRLNYKRNHKWMWFDFLEIQYLNNNLHKIWSTLHWNHRGLVFSLYFFLDSTVSWTNLNWFPVVFVSFELLFIYLRGRNTFTSRCTQLCHECSLPYTFIRLLYVKPVAIWWIAPNSLEAFLKMFYVNLFMSVWLFKLFVSFWPVKYSECLINYRINYGIVGISLEENIIFQIWTSGFKWV